MWICETGKIRLYLKIMAIFLLIETSATVCSVALSADDEILTKYVCTEEMQHAAKLPVFVDQALHDAAQRNLKIDAVAISGGPGSYTGLRIGTSTAKGLCYALDAKLIAVNTLELIAFQAAERIDADTDALICPMVDARRMEVYTAMYDNKLNLKAEPSAKIIDDNSYSEYGDSTIYFCGNGAGKCKNTIRIAGAQYIEDIMPLAEKMVSLAVRKYLNGEVENVAYYEPFYLKEFQTTISTNNVIGK